MNVGQLLAGLGVATVVFVVGGYLGFRWRRTGKPTSWLDRARIAFFLGIVAVSAGFLIGAAIKGN